MYNDDYGEEEQYGNEGDHFNEYLNGNGGYQGRGYKMDFDDYGASAAYMSKPMKPRLPEMPPEAEMEKPFILYMDSLNRVNSMNMQCLR